MHSTERARHPEHPAQTPPAPSPRHRPRSPAPSPQQAGGTVEGRPPSLLTAGTLSWHNQQMPRALARACRPSAQLAVLPRELLSPWVDPNLLRQLKLQLT